MPLWSRIGRLKRSVWPKLTGGGHAYGGGASAGVLSAVAGRVLCDTYLSGAWLGTRPWARDRDGSGLHSVLEGEPPRALRRSSERLGCVCRAMCRDACCAARELVREVDFTLRTLSASLLGQERGDLTSSDVPKCYQSTQVRLANAIHLTRSC